MTSPPPSVNSSSDDAETPNAGTASAKRQQTASLKWTNDPNITDQVGDAWYSNGIQGKRGYGWWNHLTHLLQGKTMMPQEQTIYNSSDPLHG